jgi:nucleotide-binding universal stress UspA family protein
VLVEKVEGITTKTEVERAYREICEFEQMLTDDGIRIVKLFLHVSARGGHAAGGEALLAPPPRPAVHPDRDEGRLKIWTEEAERLAPGAVTSIELMGSPAEEIVRCAREFGCDLLVMGTHGRSGIGHLALGSVAEAVIRAAPCPVLVVRPQAE